MVHVIQIESFTSQKRCVYKGRIYYVRDNGAVYRLRKDGGRIRRGDEEWTFGKLNKETKYLYMGTERIHRIVCTAFHGDAPTAQHVVDHIDTNRQNNRPENLRWLTKLENTLNNPITVKRIISCCGSIEAFIENPALIRDSEENRDISWMRRCSPAEAKVAYDNLSQWAAKPVPITHTAYRNHITEVIYKSFKSDKGYTDTSSDFQHNVIQRNWSTPTEFPPCPHNNSENPIASYLNNLTEQCITSKNEYGVWHLVKANKHETENAIVILSVNRESLKPWSICKVFYEDSVYIHQSLGTFFLEIGGEKYYEIYSGRKWDGEDCLDDYTC